MITSLKNLLRLNEYSVSERHTDVRALAREGRPSNPYQRKRAANHLLSWPPFSRKATHQLTTQNDYIL